jgi:hypothetical protein
MPTRFYDVIALGRETSVVAAAALLARRGFRILWLGDGPAADSYPLAGLRLPLEPFVMCAAERPAVGRVGDELNLSQTLRRRLPPHRPAFQVVLPRARLDVGGAETLGPELDREFADVRPLVDGYFRAVKQIDGSLDDLLGLPVTFPPRGFWERREVARVLPALRRLPDPLAALPESHAFRAFCDVPVAFAADAVAESLTPLLRARVAANWRRGTFRVPGGRAGLTEIFLEKSGGHSAEMQPDVRAARLTIQRGRVTGVLPEGRDEPLGCDFLVAGVRPDRLLALMGEGRPARRFSEMMAAVPVAARRYTVNLVLPAEALPEGMSSLVVAATGKDGTTPPLLLMTTGPDEQGRVVLTAGTLVPPTNGVSRMREGVVRRLAEVVPFVERHALLCHSPHDGLPPTGPLGSGVEPLPALDMPPVFRPAAKAPHGLGGLPYETGLKNAFYAGRASLPGLGVEGELEAAWGVARIISRKRKAPDPFRKRSLFGPR